MDEAAFDEAHRFCIHCGDQIIETVAFFSSAVFFIAAGARHRMSDSDQFPLPSPGSLRASNQPS